MGVKHPLLDRGSLSWFVTQDTTGTISWTLIAREGEGSKMRTRPIAIERASTVAQAKRDLVTRIVEYVHVHRRFK